MSEQFDIVIVGGGIAGSAIGTVLARAGRRVKILERDQVYQDRVRGEFIAPWGVKELQRLNLLDILSDAGGIFVGRVIPYDENTPPDMAEKFALDFKTIAPDLPPSLCMGHPAMCEVLNQAAQAAGADVSRGVKSVKVSKGDKPEISYRLEGQDITLRPRLIIGADGRNSLVRKQTGMVMQNDPPHNLLGGMLVEGKTSWPQDSFAIGTEGDIHFLIFPQGQDKLRLYICYSFEDRARFSGPDREKNLLQAFRLNCLPQGEEIAACRPISPFHAYSNEDHWIDQPIAPGVLLIGDAAGHCDPVTGQGLSLALRDVRIVSDLLRTDDLSPAAFAPYVEERRERLRRTRFTAKCATVLRVEFGEENRARRQRAHLRVMNEKFLTPTFASFLGPEALPAAYFEQSTLDALLAP